MTGRLAYLPAYVGTTSAGLLFGRNALYVINARAAKLQSNSATLSVYGACIDWNDDLWRVIGVDYYVDVMLDRSTPNESFSSGYLQGSASRSSPA